MHPDILREKEMAKMESNDRILHLSVIDDKKPISTYGTVDNRLFKGGNKLHAIRDPQSYMWYLKYESGPLPDPLKQRFTKFNILLDHVKTYYGKRNLDIVDIEHVA